MGNRGRPSLASMELMRPLQRVQTIERPRAPHDLTDEETEVWAAVVSGEEASWFTPATLPLLAQYCRHCVHARRLGEMLEKATSDVLKVKDYERLLRMQRSESQIMMALATKMRLSQQSITNHYGHHKKTSTAQKPWEG